MHVVVFFVCSVAILYLNLCTRYLVEMWVLSWAFNAYFTSVCEELSQNLTEKYFRVRCCFPIHKKNASQWGNSWKFRWMLGQSEVGIYWSRNLGFIIRSRPDYRHLILHIFSIFFYIDPVHSGSVKNPILFLSYFLVFTELSFSFWQQTELVLKLFFFFFCNSAVHVCME